MLRVEICLDSTEDSVIEPGTYKLNHPLTESIHICESLTEGVYSFDGYVNIQNESEIERFAYTSTSRTTDSEHCVEEALPSKRYKDLWHSIVYSEKDKYELFETVMRMELADAKMREIFGINRCVLIHGEPGTGKSTLSKAIIQKLAIRLGKVYSLKMIKCSQLFSRFYGESMKIIENMMKSCQEDTVIMIDEADSLLMKRSHTFTKNEPADSLRIVNTILNIIDTSKNLIIFTTNFKDELDEAFLSRCDVVFQMKTLEHEHVYTMLKEVIEKMQVHGILESYQFSDFSSVTICGKLSDKPSLTLFDISKKLKGLSPRRIKKRLFGLINDRKMELQSFIKRLETCVQTRE